MEDNECEQFSRKTRFYIYAIYICLLVFINGDNGVLFSSKKYLSKDLGLDEISYGFFCSFYLVGRIFGTFIFKNFVENNKGKFLPIITTFINGSALFIFYFTFNKYILFGVRFLIGFIQIFSHFYFPYWIDHFGIKRFKSIMMLILDITTPLGRTLGYIFGTINSPDKWYFNYIILGSIILFFNFLLLLAPGKYFSMEYHFKGYKKEGIYEFEKSTEDLDKISYFEKTGIKIKKRSKGSMIEILKKPLYCLSILAKANCLLLFQVIHSNITSYAFDDLKIPDQEKFTKFLPLYSAACLIGQTPGSLFGGFLVANAGGFDNKKTSLILVGFAIIALFSSFIVIYSNSIILLCFGIFLLVFFVFALLVIISGYIARSIPIQHKGAGSTLNSLISSILGSVSGSILFGFLENHFKETNPKLAWKLSIHTFIFGFSCILGSAWIKYNELKEIEKEEFNKND